MIDRILIADDEFLVRQFMEESIRRAGIEPVPAVNGNDALEILQKTDVQMAFVDLQMGDITGMDVLRECRKLYPHILFVIMTAYGTIETAVEAMQLGAFDFIIKPFTPNQASVLIDKAKQWLQLNEKQEFLIREIEEIRGGDKKIIGSSHQTDELLRLIQRVAPTMATVLVSGESGTGKELIANEIRRISDPRSKRPYIRMNCAAVPEALLESELFGHEKGAFTGAADRRIGRFELANNGTLLLDEIGEISKAMQAKLLRVLQESEFERVGGSKTISVNVRVIATTNRNLKKEVEKGNFREDLFYRLNVFPIYSTPLRERKNDIIEIGKIFLQRQEKKLNRKLEFSLDALECMINYSWPGNVRELENVIERIAILEDGPTITANAFPLDILYPNSTPSGVPIELDTLFNLQEIEKRTIIRALIKTNNNRTKAARLMGFTVRTLRNKLIEYKNDKEFAPFIKPYAGPFSQEMAKKEKRLKLSEV